ncbi:Vacuole morphology and inheritance protein 14 [Ceratocystis lukuohia]|uniref:Vacuole morphology and inheritance protein 14 n=1 Tax=Ceratocystis lukuohia TaxID=2019550 RepID=A0ABR4MLB8_9PEZI
MTHLLPKNAIFSPSVARIAASTSRDWNYVDSWLAAKYRSAFPGRDPPEFERTPETLKALHALASFDEAAGEDRDAIAAAEASSLEEVNAARDAPGKQLRDALLEAVEDSLTAEGAAALDVMSALAVSTGTALPSPIDLGHVIADLQGQSCEIQQMASRVDALLNYIRTEALPGVNSVLRGLEQDGYDHPTDLARQNLDSQRRIKTAASRLPAIQDQAAAAAATDLLRLEGVPSLARIMADENEYFQLLAVKKDLDAQLTIFQGLPTDMHLARAELDNLRTDLEKMRGERDETFESLVERETPRKPRQ